MSWINRPEVPAADGGYRSAPETSIAGFPTPRIQFHRLEIVPGDRGYDEAATHSKLLRGLLQLHSIMAFILPAKKSMVEHTTRRMMAMVCSYACTIGLQTLGDDFPMFIPIVSPPIAS